MVEIKKGTIIGEYTGVYTSNDLSEEELIYSFFIDDTITLVGTGILSRINDIIDFRKLTKEETKLLDKHILIKHSLEYNCEFIQKGKKVFVKSIKTIFPGDELYIQYGNWYWEQRYVKNGLITEY